MTNLRKFCSQCGNPLKPGTKFCMECGSPVGRNNKNIHNPTETAPEKEIPEVTPDAPEVRKPAASQTDQKRSEYPTMDRQVKTKENNKNRSALKWIIVLVIIALMFKFRNELYDFYILLLPVTGLWVLIGIINPRWAMLGKKVSRLKVFGNGLIASLLIAIMIATAVSPSTPPSDMTISSDDVTVDNSGDNTVPTIASITKNLDNNTITPSYKFQKYSANGIEITLPPCAVTEETQLQIENTEKAPQIDNEITNILGSYKITLGDKHKFDSDLEIEIPYDKNKLKSDNPREFLDACYLNEDTNSWEQVRTSVDDEKITLYMDHLTTVTVVESARKKMRQIKSLGEIDNELLKKAAKIGNMDENSATKNLEMIGWSQALNSYGLMGSSTTLMEEVLKFSKLSGANNIMKNLGATTAVIQVMAEVSDGKYEAATQTGIKGFISYAIAHWGSSALNVAGVAMFAIDYSLTTLGNEAKRLRKDMLNKIYNEYYLTEGKRSPTDWYNVLWNKVTTAGSQEEMKQSVEKALDDYVNLIWNDEGAVASLQAELQGHGWTFEAGFTKEQKERLNREHKALLIKSLQPVFFSIEKNLRSRIIKEKVRAKIKAEQFLEYPMQIRVSMVGGNPGDKARAKLFKDDKVVAETNGFTIKDPYTSNYIAEFSIRIIDYISYGMPETIRVTVTGSNGEKKSQSKKIRISRDMYGISAHVNTFEFEAPKIPDENDTNDNTGQNASNDTGISDSNGSSNNDSENLTPKQQEVLNAINSLRSVYEKHYYAEGSEKDKLFNELKQEYKRFINTASKYVDTGKYTGSFMSDFHQDETGQWVPKYEYDIVEALYSFAQGEPLTDDDTDTESTGGSSDTYNNGDDSSSDLSNMKPPTNEVEKAFVEFVKASNLYKSLPEGEEKEKAEREMTIKYNIYLELVKKQAE